MKKITRITESDLTRIIRKVISEESTDTENLYSAINTLIDSEYGKMDPNDIKNVLNNILDNYEGITYRKQRGTGSVNRDEVISRWEQERQKGRDYLNKNPRPPRIG